MHRLDSGDQAASASYGASNGPRRIVAAYDYRDEAGALLYQAVRYLPEGFAQRQPDGSGGWIWNVKDVRLVLYRLTELRAADPAAPVFIPEGEKDVENLRTLGFVATCNAMGAGKWRAEYNAFLRGRLVVLLPHNDKAGADHARTVANALTGIAASVKVLTLPGLSDRGDVSDWLTMGGSANGRPPSRVPHRNTRRKRTPYRTIRMHRDSSSARSMTCSPNRKRKSRTSGSGRCPPGALDSRR